MPRTRDPRPGQKGRRSIAESAKAGRQSRGVLIRVNPEGLKALRLLSVELDRPLQALGVEALNDLLEKYGRRPTVRNPLRA